MVHMRTIRYAHIWTWIFQIKLANNFRKCRENASQARYTRKLGISHPTPIRRDNAQQNTTIATLERVCKARKCDISDIFEIL